MTPIAWDLTMSNPTIDHWPTHMRFSRRIGEAVPDAMYACALEGPRPGRSLAFIRVAMRALGALVQRALGG